jgi:hypothetical protein
MNEIDMDQMEVYDIIRRLKLISEVWRSENCPLPIDFWPDPFYIAFVPEKPNGFHQIHQKCLHL